MVKKNFSSGYAMTTPVFNSKDRSSHSCAHHGCSARQERKAPNHTHPKITRSKTPFDGIFVVPSYLRFAASKSPSTGSSWEFLKWQGRCRRR